ncbi:MAG: TCR/Tet family MFS transporter [Pseudomonadota bacterium]
MRPSDIVILSTVMIDAMGIGLILPVMPALIEEIQGGSLAQAAIWGGILSTVFAIMQFLFGPVLGALSDAIGRRPVILVSLFVLGLDYLIMATAGSMWILLIGRIIGGITSATHATASAYMADISKPEDKAANFGLVAAAFGAGFVLGPLIGGLLAEFGTRAPFYAAAGLSVLNGCIGLLVLRETVTDRIRRPFSWANANPFGALRYIGRLPGLMPLLIVMLFYQLAINTYPAIWAFFTRARFGWSPQMIGFSLALFGIAIAAIQGGLIRVVLKYWGERRTVILGHVFEIAAFTAIVFVASGTGLLILTPLAALGAIASPALQGLMSQRVGDDEQGALQGVIMSISSLAMILSPLLMTNIFAAFTREGAALQFPGAPFAVATGLILVGLLIFLRHERQDTTHQRHGGRF